MSVRPEVVGAATASARKKVTPNILHQQRAAGTPITMLTAYDYPTAKACSANPLIDITLVGDSLAQVCLGYESTTQLTLREMLYHVQAVARGTKHPMLVADMPFGSYQLSVDEAVANAFRLVQEGRAEGVKIEGGQEIAHIVRRITQAGIPVMGHIGLMPQRYLATSGYRVQGRDLESAKRVVTDALYLQDAGAFALLVEGVPKELGKHVTEKVSIPTIGIGAGPSTSGQVLVWDDMMGTWSGHKAKFVRRFADVQTHRDVGVDAYAKAVRDRSFPSPDTESYTMDPAVLAELQSML
ncbi:ketopantoate hydroxymethyltransferase [Cylindrobasidium torrendii FP15055 ss-10]|uniref:3-methyl-2-oxobutanoate hydroxymethyltransferase n=1 Tax=Cylindrobasidium torrendii FP15055 ss-10 TaxID=1314674 RepID=A0A0D7B030_9AGAR|nr:ketopantoate hydroxymethyltransferase [Cylindrobasidium torrendii FP15055 ss-10]